MYRSIFDNSGAKHLSQLNALQSEKESVENKLREAQTKVFSLEMENASLKSKSGKAAGY